MVEVKDEILNGQPLYRIRDDQGNVLHNNVTLEMITQLIQAGTPLNKSLFDKIQNASLNEIKLSGAFNKTYINVSLEDFNMPELTVDDTQGFVASYDSNNTWAGGIDAYSMFNGNGLSSMVGGNGIIYLEAPYYIKPTNIRIKYRHIHVTIKASVDNISWDTIASYSDAGAMSDTTHTFTITQEKYYKYFQFSFSPYNSPGNMKVYNNIFIKGFSTMSLDNVYMQIGEATDKLLSEDYYEGQIIKIETPNNYIPADNLNIMLKVFNLEPKSITSSLTASKKYELIYDGTAFNATEVV